MQNGTRKINYDKYFVNIFFTEELFLFKHLICYTRSILELIFNILAKTNFPVQHLPNLKARHYQNAPQPNLTRLTRTFIDKTVYYNMFKRHRSNN